MHVHNYQFHGQKKKKIYNQLAIDILGVQALHYWLGKTKTSIVLMYKLIPSPHIFTRGRITP